MQAYVAFRGPHHWSRFGLHGDQSYCLQAELQAINRELIVRNGLPKIPSSGITCLRLAAKVILCGGCMWVVNRIAS